MADIRNKKVIWLKGVLFLVCAVLSSVLIVAEQPKIKVALLLCIAIWCSARFYYFMFYVIEKYTDPGYRFSGIYSFVKYFLQKRKA